MLVKFIFTIIILLIIIGGIAYWIHTCSKNNCSLIYESKKRKLAICPNANTDKLQVSTKNTTDE